MDIDNLEEFTIKTPFISQTLDHIKCISIYQLPYELLWTSLSLIQQKLKNNIGVIGDNIELS